MPGFTERDEPAVAALRLVLAQLERADAALERTRGRDLLRLRADARAWANTARAYFESLALTPSSRARLGLDLSRVEESMVASSQHAWQQLLLVQENHCRSRRQSLLRVHRPCTIFQLAQSHDWLFV